MVLKKMFKKVLKLYGRAKNVQESSEIVWSCKKFEESSNQKKSLKKVLRKILPKKKNLFGPKKVIKQKCRKKAVYKL